MLITYLKYLGVLVLLIFIQKNLIWLLAVSNYNITPDIVVVAVIWIGIRRGNIVGSAAGFTAGIMNDLLSGSFLGLSALAYTIAGFIAGYFMRPEDDKYLFKHFFLIAVALCGFISNLIYFSIYFQGLGVSYFNVFFIFVLSTLLYTLLLSVIYVVIPKRGDARRVY